MVNSHPLFDEGGGRDTPSPILIPAECHSVTYSGDLCVCVIQNQSLSQAISCKTCLTEDINQNKQLSRSVCVLMVALSYRGV